MLPRRDALGALELQRDQLIASDDVVSTQIAAMDVALNDLGDGQFCMGEYHYSLVIFGESGKDGAADAGRRAAQAIGAVGESSSLQMAPVDLVADAAWFAQLPGNWQWRPRKPSSPLARSRRWPAVTAFPGASATGIPGARPWRCCGHRPASPST
jgi:type IV secretion system protein VirB4